MLLFFPPEVIGSPKQSPVVLHRSFIFSGFRVVTDSRLVFLFGFMFISQVKYFPNLHQRFKKREKQQQGNSGHDRLQPSTVCPDWEVILVHEV
jgi:hypothetical protein